MSNEPKSEHSHQGSDEPPTAQSQLDSTPSSSDSPLSPTSSKLHNSQDADKKVLEELSKEMIKSTGDYIKGEIDICIADYKMLEQMNKLVTEKYKSLNKNSTNIISEMEKLNEAYLNLTPLLAQIDMVEKSVDELETTASKLDAYSKRLETKFKQFTDKISNK